MGQLAITDDLEAEQIHELKPAGVVECFPIPTLLEALGVKHVDFFSLDIEGLELRVLKTLPFTDQLEIDVSAFHLIFFAEILLKDQSDCCVTECKVFALAVS